MNAYKNKLENEDEKMEFLNIGSELGLFKNQTTDKDWEELNFVTSMDRKLHGGDIDLGESFIRFYLVVFTNFERLPLIRIFLFQICMI